MPTLPQPLVSHEVPGYAQAHPSLPDRAYLLELAGATFGLLYVTPDRYTLAWDGNLSFEMLPSEVEAFLTLVFGGPAASLSDPGWRERVEVILVCPRGPGDDDLQEFHLSDHAERVRYAQALSQPATVAFARYDIFDRGAAALGAATAVMAALIPGVGACIAGPAAIAAVAGGARFSGRPVASFIAENAALQGGRGEMSVVLSSVRACSGALFGWAARHHAGAFPLTTLEAEQAAAQVHALVRAARSSAP